MKGDHNRERVIEQLLRESWLDTAASQPCVEAETLAAWAEGTLSPAETRSIEAHASRCDRCQSMLAVLARAEPGPIVPVATAPFWQRWRLQWLVPATALATALAVWVAVPRDWPRSPGQSAARVEGSAGARAVAPGNSAAGNEALAPPPGPDGRQDESTRAQESQRGRQGSLGAQLPGREGSQSVQRREVEGAGASAAGRQQDGRPAEEKQAATNPPGQPAAQIDPADTATAGDSVAKAERPLKDTDNLQRPRAVPPSVAAPSSPPAAAITPAPQGTLPDSARALAQSAPLAVLAGRVGPSNGQIAIEVVSPDTRHRWRIEPGGQLQHSSAAGSAWQAASVAGSDVFTGGMSPGGSVCWMVGRNGAVWLTTDGLRFERRPFPEPIDLVSVRATDAVHATLASADGRTFVTADGGMTWRY